MKQLFFSMNCVSYLGNLKQVNNSAHRCQCHRRLNRIEQNEYKRVLRNRLTNVDLVFIFVAMPCGYSRFSPPRLSSGELIVFIVVTDMISLTFMD